jgi:hypothetical protein
MEINIKNKSAENELTITQADEGKTVRIPRIENYKQQVNNFIQKNQFTMLNRNPMQNYKKV